MFAGQISREHAAALRTVVRSDREEQARREAAADAWAARCATMAPAYHEALELQRAKAAAREARLERAAEQARQARAAAAEDYVAGLLMAGHRRHTVAEVLAAARGQG